MNTTIAALDSVTTLAFLGAAVFMILSPVCDEGPLSRGARSLLVLAFCTYVVVGFGNVLQYTGTSMFLEDNVQDILKAIFMPLLAYTAYVMRLTMRLKESRQATRMLQSQYGMLSTMFDGISSGIVLVDREGRIHLANDPAKEMLRLRLDDASGHYVVPRGTTWWDADASDAEGVSLFTNLCTGVGQHEHVRVVSWPDGANQKFSFDCHPMRDRTGGENTSMLVFDPVPAGVSLTTAGA